MTNLIECLLTNIVKHRIFLQHFVMLIKMDNLDANGKKLAIVDTETVLSTMILDQHLDILS